MTEWWRDAVIYQIYPRSFQDSDGTGTGDLRGITRRLDHVASLGVDAIWLSPFFASPDRDMGYDVSDYTAVSDTYGDIADFDALLARAHDLRLRVIIDQVVNHSSDQHPWFVESRASRDNPKSDWYIWADPGPAGEPPNNWLAVFGGSSWQFDARRRQYYLHSFLPEQPDLNFRNPDLMAAVQDAMRFWLDRGVDGFRLDTSNYYMKDAQLRSNPPRPYDTFPINPYDAQSHRYDISQPGNLDVLRAFRALADDYPDRMLVGEVGDAERQIELMGEYTSGTDKLHLAYSFEFLDTAHTAAHFRSGIRRFQDNAPDGWPCWSFSNHDVRRHVSRWTPEGGDTDAVAKQSVALLATLPGALGLYQGEELGQTETDIEFHELRDLGYIDFWPENKGRDGCRTPMVWDASKPNAGFSTGEPWLPVKAPQAANAVAGQETDGDSVLHHYRDVLAFRKDTAPLRRGTTTFPDLPEPLLAIARTHEGRCVTGLFNLSDTDRTVRLGGDADPIGPAAATVADGKVRLPAWGWVWLASTGPVDLSA